jgi:hypothetical protein
LQKSPVCQPRQLERGVSTQEGQIVTIYLKPKHLAAWLVTAGAAVAIAATPTAAADLVVPMAGAESVSSTVSDLKAQGFNVMINYLQGSPNVPLSECQVTAINNPSAPTANPLTVTVSVDVACPNAK